MRGLLDNVPYWWDASALKRVRLEEAATRMGSWLDDVIDWTRAGVLGPAGMLIPPKPTEADSSIPTQSITRVTWAPVGQDCPAGFKQVGDHCEKDVTQEYVQAPPPSVIVVPDIGPTPGTFKPVSCPSGFDRNADTGECTPKCPSGTYKDPATGACIVAAVIPGPGPVPRPAVNSPWYMNRNTQLMLGAGAVVLISVFMLFKKRG